MELAFKEDIFFKISCFDIKEDEKTKLIDLIYSHGIEQRIFTLESRIDTLDYLLKERRKKYFKSNREETMIFTLETERKILTEKIKDYIRFLIDSDSSQYKNLIKRYL